MNTKKICQLASARQVHSPNFDERPTGQEINLLVIHAISLPPGDFGGQWVEQFFTNQLDPEAHPYFKAISSLKVSAHLYICRNGELLQFVDFDKRAWHAGVSMFQNISRCNDFSIGIELEGSDDKAFSSIQYQQLTKVTRELQDLYPAITVERIVGHCEIAPDRKTDPGPLFDWDRYRRSINKGTLNP